MLMEREPTTAGARGGADRARACDAFGIGDRWAYHALHDDGRCYGMSETRCAALRDAALVINLHGGTSRPGSSASASSTSRPIRCSCRSSCTTASPSTLRVPARAQRLLHLRREPRARPAARCPSASEFRFRPTRQPVVLDLWARPRGAASDRFTTIGNWHQGWRTVHFDGETYRGARTSSGALPRPARRTGQRFELALSGYEPRHREQLEAAAGRSRHALDFGDRRRTPTATSSPARAASSPSPRTRTSASARAGSATAARPTSPPAGPSSPRTPASAAPCPTGEGLFAVSDLDERRRRGRGHRRRLRAPRARRGRDRARALRRRARARRPAAQSSDSRPPRSPAPERRDRTARAEPPHGCAGLAGPRAHPALPVRGVARRRARVAARQTRPLDGIVVIDDASDAPPTRHRASATPA